jgi:fructosamine-3-kinase
MRIKNAMAKSKQLLTGVFNAEIEQIVSDRTGFRWSIRDISECAGPAMHGTAIFTGEDGRRVFVKEGANPFSYDQFVQEAWGLTHIHEESGARTPEVYGVKQQGGVTILIMEAIAAKPVESKRDWEILGRALAELHKTTRPQCGLETHSYLGVFRQDNRQCNSWTDFFANRRLLDSYKLAEEAAKLEPQDLLRVRRLLDKLIARLPEICGPAQPNSLLHGDPWIGNIIYDGAGGVFIDCGIYYGNREIDLSTVSLFAPVSCYFFDAYHECYPVDPGYKDRVNLWRVNQWLGHVTLSAKYLPKLLHAIGCYVE